MVTVAADDEARVLVHLLGPALSLVPILPAGGGHDDEEAQLVAGIHERRVLRVVGSADDGVANILKPLGITPLLTVGQGVPHVGKVLVTVAANELVIGFTVKPEAVIAPELSLADAHTDYTAIGPTPGREGSR